MNKKDPDLEFVAFFIKFSFVFLGSIILVCVSGIIGIAAGWL